MQDWTPEQLKEHLSKGDAVFLKLWKKGCGACRLSTSATDKIEAADQRGLTFGRISVDDHPELLELAGTDVLPAFLVFAGRQKKGMFTGFKGQKKLENFIDESLLSKGGD